MIVFRQNSYNSTEKRTPRTFSPSSAKLHPSPQSKRRPPPSPNYQSEASVGLRQRQTIRAKLAEAYANAKLSGRSNRRPPLTPNYQSEASGDLRQRQTIRVKLAEAYDDAKLSGRNKQRPPMVFG